MSTKSSSSKEKRPEPKPSRRKRRRKNHCHKARAQCGDLPLCFGRYNGKPIASVPRSYLRWMLRTKGIPAGDRWLVEQFIVAEGLDSGRGSQ